MSKNQHNQQLTLTGKLIWDEKTRDKVAVIRQYYRRLLIDIEQGREKRAEFTAKLLVSNTKKLLGIE